MIPQGMWEQSPRQGKLPIVKHNSKDLAKVDNASGAIKSSVSVSRLGIGFCGLEAISSDDYLFPESHKV